MALLILGFRLAKINLNISTRSDYTVAGFLCLNYRLGKVKTAIKSYRNSLLPSRYKITYLLDPLSWRSLRLGGFLPRYSSGGKGVRAVKAQREQELLKR